MANILTNSWSKLKDIPKNWWKNSVEGAPPATRDLTVAFAPLVRIVKDEQGKKIGEVPVGSYVPEIKILADAGQLMAQIEEKKWLKDKEAFIFDELVHERPDIAFALYRSDDNKTYIRKTPFELAVVPSFSKGFVQKMMEREYKYRRDHHLPLPSLVSKYRIEPDFLRDIGKAGLALKAFPTGFKINIDNPVSAMSLREKLLHYTAQWAAWLLTITGAVTIGVTNPWLFAAGALGLYLANKTGKDFGLYDVAEVLLRDYQWLTSKEFGWKGKISWRKTAETAVYVSALAFAGFLAVSGAWAGVMAFPCWSWLAANGVGLAAVEALQLASAGFFAAVAAASTYAAVTFPIRYFWGLTIYDNQEHPTHAEVNRLPEIDVSKDLSSALDRCCQKGLNKIVKPKYQLSPEDRVAIFTDYRDGNKGLIKEVRKIEEAANHNLKEKVKHKGA